MRNFRNFDERISYYRDEMMRYAPPVNRDTQHHPPKQLQTKPTEKSSIPFHGNAQSDRTNTVEQFALLSRRLLPRRILFGKGTGARGDFLANGAASDWTTADFFRAGSKTPVLVRFSLMSGTEGSADSLRDYRGFSTRFYTSQGNLDLLCGSLPVFWLRNTTHLPELVSALFPPQRNDGKKRECFWKMVSETSELLPVMMWLYSDQGTQKSYRTMNGFSMFPQIWIAADGTRRYVRCRWQAKEEAVPMSQEEALLLSGVDPDAACRDLYEAILQKNFPVYELYAQALPETLKEIDPMDTTATWPESVAPWKKIGEMELNRNPEDFFEQVERVAFHPGHVVSGIELPKHSMMTQLCLCCSEAQRYRLGLNYHQFSANRKQSGEEGNLPQYSVENSLGEDQSLLWDDLGHARICWESFDAIDRRHLAQNIALELKYIEETIREKLLEIFQQIADDFRKEVEQAFGA